MRLMFQLFRIALRSLASHKLRSALTMLGVIIGVGAVVVMVSIGEGARRRVERDIKRLGTNLLIVRPWFARRGPVRMQAVQTLVLGDAQAIEREVRGVAAVSPEAGQMTQVKYFAQNTTTSILGATPAYLQVVNFTLADGRFLTAEDVRRQSKVAVVGATPARELFGRSSAVGETIKIRGVNFEIVGMLESKGQSGYRDPDDMILVPLTTAMRRLFGLQYLRAVYVQVASEDAMDTAHLEIEDLLRRRHRLQPGAVSDFNIRNQKDILETMGQVTQTFTLLLAAVAAVSMLVGGIGIMNIMLVSVTERTREIGIRKAVGARRRDILFQFLVEAVVLSILGGLAGVGAGIGASYGIAATGSWETALVWRSIVLAFGVAAGTGIFFGLYPAYQASRMDPIEALRHE